MNILRFIKLNAFYYPRLIIWLASIIIFDGIIFFFISQISAVDLHSNARQFNFVSKIESEKMGKQFINYTISEVYQKGHKVLSKASVEQQRVENILSKLDSASPWFARKDVNIDIVEYHEKNALYYGAGHIIIFTGLLNVVNDDELAFVISHEIIHMLSNHLEENYTIANSKSTKRFLNLEEVLLKQHVKQEEEADNFGVHLVANAKFDPCGIYTLRKKIEPHPTSKSGKKKTIDDCVTISENLDTLLPSKIKNSVLECSKISCKLKMRYLDYIPLNGLVAFIKLINSSYYLFQK